MQYAINCHAWPGITPTEYCFSVNKLSCNINKDLYWQIMVFLDLGSLLFKPLTSFGGLKNKIPRVQKHHNLAIEVFIHTVIIDEPPLH